MTQSEPQSLLRRRDLWGHGVSLWIIVAVALVLPVMCWSLLGLRMHNDVAGWLPQDDPQAKLLSWYQKMFPSEDRVLVTWDTCSLTDPALNALEEALEGTPNESGTREGGSPYISDVSLPSEALRPMLKADIPFDTAMMQLDGLLIGKGPLKIRYTDAGRMRGSFMEKEVLRVLREEHEISAVVTKADMPLPAGDDDIPLEDADSSRVDDALRDYVRSIPLYDLQLEWQEMRVDAAKYAAVQETLLNLKAPASGATTAGEPCIEACFDVGGSIAAASVSLTEAGSADKAASIAAIREALNEIGVPEDTVHLGGQPVVNVALNRSVADACWNPAFEAWDLPHRSPIALSAIVTILLSFVMLRSIRLATLVQSVSFLTVVIAVAIVPLTGGSMNMVLIVMPTLLAVLTTSAAIHLSNYWKHSNADTAADSVIDAAKTAWLPCALAAGTTAIGLASLLASNLVPVRQFGIYSAIGCLISFVVVLYVLPSLMMYWPRVPPKTQELKTAHWKSFGMWIARNRILVGGLCLVMTAVAGRGLQYFRTETKVIRYFPQDSRLVRDYVFLEDKLSGVISVDTIVKFDSKAQQQHSFIQRAQIVRDLQREIRQHEEISGVLSLASFLDLPESDAKLRARDRLAHRRTEQVIKKRLEAKESGDSIVSMLAIADTATDWYDAGDQKLNKQGDEIWRVTAQASVLSDLDLEVLLQDMNEIAASHLGLVGSPGTGHVVTGLIPVFLRTQQAVLESLIRSFGMAFVIIAIVMMILLRSPGSGLITMLPNLMPVVLVFGTLSWMQLKVDIGTMITASVALGIAVDGTLHLITWFQDLVRRGMPVEEAVGASLEHCGPAMWQTSAAVGLGMIALLPAELLLVSRFGWMMAALIFAALVADVILLPALLGGTLGRLIQKASTGGGDQEPGNQESSRAEEKESLPHLEPIHPAATTSIASVFSQFWGTFGKQMPGESKASPE